MENIRRARGASVGRDDLMKEDRLFPAAEFGAAAGGDAVKNTAAVNAAIEEAFRQGGGTVLLPEGDLHVYTLRLRSGVNLLIPPAAVLRAARDDEGGAFDEPESNPWAGLQDHGHTYFANSMLYAADEKDIMIYGGGLIDGGQWGADGKRISVLSGDDPGEPESRFGRGHRGIWFANKAAAIVRCRRVVIRDIRILHGGHFAVLLAGCENVLMENCTVDTNRDALDIDACEAVTIRGGRYNSLTDDAVVLKSSCGSGVFRPCSDVVVEDLEVSGYDEGSVLDGTRTCRKKAATDLCGPTGRVKLGTESTWGYHTVTVRRVRFRRSRGFCLETVDCAPMHDILLEDCDMEDVSSAPIFIVSGDRQRTPVTGRGTDDALRGGEKERLDHPEWVVPPKAGRVFPAVRYTPEYCREDTPLPNGAPAPLVRREAPLKANPMNAPDEKGVRGNAAGGAIAEAYDIAICRVRVRDCDPRYPVMILGTVDRPVRNVLLRDIDITFRGGLSLTDAAEQRRIGTKWEYTEGGHRKKQTLQWLVNPFFAKKETLLPRFRYDAEAGKWAPDPFNVPEAPADYPESSMLGILPAWGMYLRHVRGIRLENIALRTETPDGRACAVLDDVRNAAGRGLDLPGQVVLAEHPYRRRTGFEYVPDEPYIATCCRDIALEGVDGDMIRRERLTCPAPGTPPDSLFPVLPLPAGENAPEISGGDPPETVFPPAPDIGCVVTFGPGEEVVFRVPAAVPSGREVRVRCVLKPEGAAFDEEKGIFSFPGAKQGEYEAVFEAVPSPVKREKRVRIAVR